jgi:hypothetical protein
MYSGTTVTKRSGHLLGVHQRIDRVARRHITPLLPDGLIFPSAAEILHFEGNNGPDGIKRKSPSIDEPWHYIDPAKNHDRALIDMITDHQRNLAKALRKGNQERAAFESAWLAHAIVDGLTPAHHYPLADKIEELFGMPHDQRQTVKDKNLIRGVNKRDTLAKNWEYWGKHGIFMTHLLFEFGIAMAIIGKQFGKIEITPADLKKLRTKGYESVFRDILRQVLALKTYEDYGTKGWNVDLARAVRLKLVPLITKAVVLGWYASVDEATR